MATPTQYSDPAFITTVTLLIYQVHHLFHSNQSFRANPVYHWVFFFDMYFLPLFQVCYVSVFTRETYSKVGRELLAAIATAHPYVISVLLERLTETIQTVGMVSSNPGDE